MVAVVAEFYVAASIATGLIYGYDKAAAKRRRSRVPESFLLLLGLIGGWPGAILAQQVLRHKTRKVPFQLYFWLTVLLNLGVLAWFLFNPKGP